MKIRRRVFVFLAMFTAVGAMAVDASAQRAGFQAAGIAPPAQHPMQVAPVTPVAPFITAPVAPFVTAPVAPFGFAPGGSVFETFHAPTFFPPVVPPAVVTAPGFRGGNRFGFRSGNTVIINVAPAFGPAGFPQENIGLPPVSPIPQVLPTTVGVVPATVAPVPATVPPLPATISTIPVGMTRSQVISQLGPPSVTIITATGETLYFNGGATVILQNGQVVTSSR